MTVAEIVARLKSLENPESLAGMARYGISTDHALGISMPHLRELARQTGKDHALANELWRTGIHDARILASIVDTPEAVTADQMETWAGDFDSWDLCDQCVMNLFARTASAATTALLWSVRTEEFVKRAGFVIMARLASSDRTVADIMFERFLAAVEHESTDPRNYVKKGVNWALREIGARNEPLCTRACEVSGRLMQSGSAPARWIGRDALRVLEARATTGRLRHLGKDSQSPVSP